MKAGAGGSISGETSRTVDLGEESSAVKAVADEGFSFHRWNDGSKDNPRREHNYAFVTDVAFKAQFEADCTVIFDLGDHGIRTGGGELEQTVEYGSSATPPSVQPVDDWTFSGGDTDFSNVTSDLTVTAQYKQ